MIEHRKELRQKVEHQQAELQKALKVSEKAGHPSERISALNTELSVVSDSLTGGWDNMTDSTAARLSAWLEATRNLVSNDKPEGISPPHPAPPLDELVQEVSAGHDGVNGV